MISAAAFALHVQTEYTSRAVEAQTPAKGAAVILRSVWDLPKTGYFPFQLIKRPGDYLLLLRTDSGAMQSLRVPSYQKLKSYRACRSLAGNLLDAVINHHDRAEWRNLLARLERSAVAL